MNNPVDNLIDLSQIKDLDSLPVSVLRVLAQQKMVEIRNAVVKDPGLFIFKFAKTMDQNDRENPVKLFPDKEYLHEIIRVFMSEKLILVEKSRRMMITWLFMGLFLWDTMYHPAVNTFFVSKKEDDADDLVSRAYSIYNQLPDFLKVPVRKKYCLLEFPDLSSKIMGVSQDSDALRQQTASNILSDELAFQPYGRESIQAAKPTLEGGGRFVGVSSINGKNFFYNLLYDLE